jgi:hypothetical protein
MGVWEQQLKLLDPTAVSRSQSSVGWPDVLAAPMRRSSQAV